MLNNANYIDRVKFKATFYLFIFIILFFVGVYLYKYIGHSLRSKYTKNC